MKVTELTMAALFGLSLLLAGCATQDGATANSARAESKLSSQLVQLVQAEQSGKATAFAQAQGISLVSGSVRVIVESMPGQLDAAVQASRAVGTVEGTYDNLIQLLIPIGRLNTLAGSPAVKLVRLPLPAAPGAQPGRVAP